ncbi:MAG: leucine-rich repeat domain-containing protein [Clostridia bacterium]|nr:leucine-rich repeat domain-containing protein [Clostridia bacterium]
MMKKLLCLLLACLLLGSTLLLAACNRGGTGDPDAEKQPTGDILSKEEAALSFTLLDDGTYSVSKGGLGYAKEIVIPETYNGKPVTQLGPSAFSGAAFDKITIPESITVIGAGAFNNCANVKHITLPSSITAIPDNAFNSCIYLEEITIPAKVTSIGVDAFRGCTTLTSVTVPEGVTSIGADAFYGCHNLKSITLPSTLEMVGARAFTVVREEDTFTEFDPLTYYKLDNNLYLGNDQNPRLVLILLGDKSQTSYTVHADTRVIYSYALAYTALESVTLHDNVTHISDYAFYSSSALTAIHVPDKVTHIGASAFAYCSKLKVVTGMNNIVTIGAEAFRGCASGLSVNIGSTLQKLGYNIFGGRTNMAGITEGNISYIGNSENPHLILIRAINRDKQSDYTIHPDTKFIYEYAFYNCDLTTEITVPTGVVHIARCVFLDCNKLNYVQLPNTLTVIEPYAFENCKKITSIVVPDSVTYIGDGAFYNCTGIAKITLPFVGRTPTGGNVLFGSVFGASAIGQHVRRVPSALRNVIITGGTTIGAGAFSDCENIESITLPASLKTIGEGAFFFTKSLKRIYISDLGAWCGVTVTNSSSSPFTTGASLYIGNKKAEDLVIPDTVTAIQPFTFIGCPGIKSLTVSDSVLTIGDDSFKDCVNLETVNLGSGVKEVRSSAFENCAKLTSITLSPVLEILDSSSLRGCVLLEEITLPKSLRFIGDHAFKNCDALETVVFEGKFGWGTTDNRIAISGESVFLWFKSKNAQYLTEDYVEYYWVRKQS